MKLKTPLVTALLFGALAAPVAAGEALSAAELKKLAPGRYAVNVMGLVHMTVTLRAGGSMSGEAKGERDRGYWSIQGQKLCVAFNKWNGGKRSCAVLSGQNGKYQGGGLSMRRI